MSEASINWAEIQHFLPGEFSEDPEENAQPELIYTLDDYRGILGRPLYPSPVGGALARFEDKDEGSRHFVGQDRLSDAVDVFPDGDPAEAFFVALASQLWGGIGLYLDTVFQGGEWPMLHLDLRPLGHKHAEPMTLIWVRRESRYLYPQYEKRGTKALIKALDLATSDPRARN